VDCIFAEFPTVEPRTALRAAYAAAYKAVERLREAHGRRPRSQPTRSERVGTGTSTHSPEGEISRNHSSQSHWSLNINNQRAVNDERETEDLRASLSLRRRRHIGGQSPECSPKRQRTATEKTTSFPSRRSRKRTPSPSRSYLREVARRRESRSRSSSDKSKSREERRTEGNKIIKQHREHGVADRSRRSTKSRSRPGKREREEAKVKEIEKSTGYKVSSKIPDRVGRPKPKSNSSETGKSEDKWTTPLKPGESRPALRTVRKPATRSPQSETTKQREKSQVLSKEENGGTKRTAETVTGTRAVTPISTGIAVTPSSSVTTVGETDIGGCGSPAISGKTRGKLRSPVWSPARESDSTKQAVGPNTGGSAEETTTEFLADDGITFTLSPSKDEFLLECLRGAIPDSFGGKHPISPSIAPSVHNGEETFDYPISF